jgi:hypothetical protein
MADENGASDRQMLAELERQRQSSARLMNKLAQRLGSLASHAPRLPGRRAERRPDVSPLKELAVEIEHVVRRRPGVSLLVAAAAGFAVARALTRRYSRSS